MPMNKHLMLAVAAAAFAASTAAQATTIDFTALPVGTAVTNQFAGVVFSLYGIPDSGGPATTNGVGLTNSRYNGSYPTANGIDIAFTGTASNVSFFFNNEGDNSFFTSGGSFYTAYNSSHDVISTGNLSGIEGALVSVAGSGIADLQIDNGRGSTGSWWFGVGNLSFDLSAPGPTPGAGLASLAAFMLLGAYARTRASRI